MRSLALFLIAGLALASGCSRPRSLTGGRFAPATPGRPRVLATRVADTDTRKHWTWSVLGDRSWVKASVAGATASLTQTYPLSAAGRSGGSPTWECSFSAQAAPGGLWRWKLVVHGSNGVTATGSGTTRSVRIVGVSDTETGLPASLRLAELAEGPVTLSLAP